MNEISIRLMFAARKFAEAMRVAGHRLDDAYNSPAGQATRGRVAEQAQARLDSIDAATPEMEPFNRRGARNVFDERRDN